MTMVERVARAICLEQGHNPDEIRGGECPTWSLFASHARAAIEAMREPTPFMCASAEDHFDRNGDDIAVCHRAMIDAALSEEAS